MTSTLHAYIPFPEQQDGLDVVLPYSENNALYNACRQLAEGASIRIEPRAGSITVIVAPITGFPDVHEMVNAALRNLPYIEITRRKAQLLLTRFPLHDGNRPLFGITTMRDVVQSMQNDPATNAGAQEAPVHEPIQETIAGTMSVTKKIARPSAAPRTLCPSDWEKVTGPPAANSQEGAQRALKTLFERRR